MIDYKKLVEELRLKHNEDRYKRLTLDAAAAIEALNRLVDLNTQRCEELRKQLREAHESYERHLNELEAQLPKRGEWIWDDKRCIYVCSVCGSPKVRENMDRQIIKEQAYCYSCGAKMEVQDESAGSL